jgi:hypothetical protein
VKWFLVILATVGLGVLVALWKNGFVEKFLGPWAAWAKWIGYFQ